MTLVTLVLSSPTLAGGRRKFFVLSWLYHAEPVIPLAGLYAKGRVLGFKRAKRNQRPDISLVQIEGVKTAADTEFYLGKRIAFVYRAKREVNGSKIRCIWGRITRSHGGSGAVKARFRNNLPAKSFGASVRVMMYPSRV
ncbi:60S ribosomal protein L33A [Mortierella alpina]|nr:60S ribosomal protein L33A [Mortierella alpina]